MILGKFIICNVLGRIIFGIYIIILFIKIYDYLCLYFLSKSETIVIIK